MINKNVNTHTLRYLEAKGVDPRENLSAEEILMEKVQLGQQILYLWQNQHTLVVGRNQNAYTECSSSFDGTIVRRTSGGGTVFHDLGNLNFTFISLRESYDLRANQEIVLRALQSLGFDAQFTGRNDLTIQGRKFSGNAFSHTKNASCHHGTILIDVDMQQLAKALNVSAAKLQSKGVKSVRSRVINLKEIDKDINVNAVKQALMRSFQAQYPSASFQQEEIDDQLPAHKAKVEKHTSEDWVWGKNPRLLHEVNKRFDWGEVTVSYETKGDKITSVAIYTDALQTAWVSELKEKLMQVPFKQVKQQALRQEEKDTLSLIVLW